jgi:hypothetical protein
LLTLFIVSTSNLYSQEPRRNIIGIHLALGQTLQLSFSTIGGGSTQGKGSFEAGIQYFRVVNDHIKFESGISWHRSNFKVTPDFIPGADMSPNYYDFDLILVPLYLRKNFSKKGFFTGGLLTSFDISKEHPIKNQTGIGIGFGMGIEISVSENLILPINPYVNIPAIIKFKDDPSTGLYMDVGIKIGIRQK